MKAGRGVLEMKDGTVYMGYFKNNKPSGLGIILYNNS